MTWKELISEMREHRITLEIMPMGKDSVSIITRVNHARIIEFAAKDGFLDQPNSEPLINKAVENLIFKTIQSERMFNVACFNNVKGKD